jgi:hypothetical protein
MGGCTATNRPERHILEQTADWNVNQFEMLTNIHFPRRRIVQFLLAASIGGSGSAFASSADDICQASSDRGVRDLKVMVRGVLFFYRI